MFNNIITKVKTQLQTFKNNHGNTLYNFLLQCCLISLAFIIFLFFIGDVEISFFGILEFILSIPILSIIIALIRLALKCVHALLPYGGLLRLGIDIIVSLVVILAIGHFIPTTGSDILMTILLIAFDLLYVAAMIYLKNSPVPEE